jgi:hypothetical protein
MDLTQFLNSYRWYDDRNEPWWFNLFIYI